ncbi:MAG: membrane protein insertion efficiency factor YidD [Candidatus Beckwithbacteria bacterium]|nr:membrane protein insertion efficiency factor YidD [Candidatus Beckwithbacteria bacterium]
MLALKLIRFYQSASWRTRSCRFIPTCSQYSYEAIAKYGILKGGFLSLKRIIKCHPWSKGGYDPLN